MQKKKSVICPKCKRRVIDRRIGRRNRRKHILRIKCSCGFCIEVGDKKYEKL